MNEIISPAKTLNGSVLLPGDKSISHRYGMIASIAEGPSRIKRYSRGADCQSTLSCMRSMGISIEADGEDTVIHGQGLDGLKAAAGELDAGNSGSTIRMLAGILAAQSFTSRIAGDESLAKRPMDRIINPLTEMGAAITATNGRFTPLTIEGRKLRAIDYTTPMASAQVKSCVLLAGLFAEGTTIVREAIRTRDHTEVALREFGVELDSLKNVITLEGRQKLTGRELEVPGDLSSAAFFLVAALLRPGSAVSIYGVGLNPTRSALLDFLAQMGAPIKVLDVGQRGGELVGDIQVKYAPVKGGVLEGATTAALIDEIPVLSILGAVSDEGLLVKDARELRVKETDRIATVAENFKRMGVRVEVHENGFFVPGKQQFDAAKLDSFGDHRIAMAFSVAALAAHGDCEIEDAGAASVSFPEFYSTLRRLAS